MFEHTVAAVMIHIHVGDVPEAFAWYERAFPEAIRRRISNPEFEYLSLGNVRLELVPAGAKP